MLARTFLTPEQLRISPEAHRGLVLCLNAMERGELTRVDVDYRDDGPSSDIFTGHFNMAEWNSAYHCGTVACIGGTAELLGKMSFYNGNQTMALLDLFYPDDFSEDGNEKEGALAAITLDQAQRALSNYLMTGSAQWADILAEA